MSKPGADPSSGISLGDALRLPKRHPACRRREAQSGSCMERENPAGDAKGKAQVAKTARLKVPMRRRGADCPVVVKKRGNARGAKGVGHRCRAWANWVKPGGARKFSRRRQPSCDGTSRMMREYQVRFCERLRAKFPGPTRQSLHFAPQKNNELFAVSDKSRHSTLCCRERAKSLVICATSNIMAWSPLMVAGSS